MSDSATALPNSRGVVRSRLPAFARRTSRIGLVGLTLLQPTLFAWTAVPMAGLVFATPAEARGGGRSTGGYSRPSVSAPARTPSINRTQPSPRTPSISAAPPIPRTPTITTSQGYARPSDRSTSISSGFGATASDRAYNARQSTDALRAMRESEQPTRRASVPDNLQRTSGPEPTASRNQQTVPTTPPRTGSSGESRHTIDQSHNRPSGGWTGGGWTGGVSSPRSPSPTPAPSPPTYGGWFATQGWNPPAYARQGQFGMWSGVFLFYMLATLDRPGHADFFRAHGEDQGYRLWREQADRLARDHSDLSRQLGNLDSHLNAPDAHPVEPNFIPADIPIDVALGTTPTSVSHSAAAAGPSASSGGSSAFGLLLTLLVLGLIVFVLWRILFASSRRASAIPVGSPIPREWAPRSSPSGGSVPPSPPPAPETILSDTRQRFRLGMQVTIDRSPFILAGLPKLPVPSCLDASGCVSVEGIGRFPGEPDFVRLYLSSTDFVELHLDEKGQVDEARWFSLIDEVIPEDKEAWKDWLGKGIGLIGGDPFQTPEGTIYARVWQPGPEWVRPRRRQEVIETLEGTRHVNLDTMLYATPTDAPAPTPEAEYLLVSAVEDEAGARIQIRAGLLLNPASLNLA